MSKVIDLTGMRFGKLTVISRSENRFIGKRKASKPYWLCQCDCGNTKEICGDNLRSGSSNSCGCETSRSTIERSEKHGFARRGKNRSRLYSIWAKMISRCECKNDKAYCFYGERGISVCEEWHEFVVFKDWAYANGYLDNLTIDRIDFNGDYEPSNCRWITQSEQTRNTRRNTFVTLGDVTHCLKEWCDELNLNYTTVQARRKKGMDIYDAMFTPVIH